MLLMKVMEMKMGMVDNNLFYIFSHFRYLHYSPVNLKNILKNKKGYNNNNMYNSIIITSCLVGSIYMFTDSLKLINKTLLLLKNKENTEVSRNLLIIDSVVCVSSGAIIIYSINYLINFTPLKI